MLLLVALGNPGGEYLINRHNIGFAVVQAIRNQHGFEPWHRARSFEGVVSEGRIAGTRTLLLQPETFMNESGRAVQRAMHYYKLPISDVTVFHDEIDLPPGKVRVKIGGTDAGHNGLRSISQSIGPDYRRVRIGVGHPGSKDLVQYYVLSDFSRNERPLFKALIEILADNVDFLVRGEDASFQNRVHLAMVAKGFGQQDQDSNRDHDGG